VSYIQKQIKTQQSLSPAARWAWLAASLTWFVVWGVVFNSTLQDVSEIWLTNNTFNHCLFIFPLCAYFLYTLAPRLMSLPIQRSYIGFVVLILAQGLWLLGFAANIALFEHAAVFAMVSAAFVAALGWPIARQAWFPLIFLVFAIPVGEELVPLFQVITADISVQLLKWSGVPVFRDGLFITIPEGYFEVAEACSGVRFFVAAVVFGVLYAYVSYRSVWRRCAFIVLAVVLPIIANGFRAYGTILIGHYSDMKYAVGADHLIYGWGFFAFVIILMVLIGNLWAEPAQAPLAKDTTRHPSWSKHNWLVTTLVVLAPLFMTFFVKEAVIGKDESIAMIERDTLPGIVTDDEGDLRVTADDKVWLPQFPAAKEQALGLLDGGADYYMALYPKNSSDSELIFWSNRLFRIDRWRYDRERQVALNIPGHTIQQANMLGLIAVNGARRLVLYWYVLPNDERVYNKGLEVKLRQAFSTLSGQGSAGAVVALSIPYAREREKAEAHLIKVAESYFNELNQSIKYKEGM
jgi:exosortase A